MPGIINSHKMLIRKNAKFIRVRHTTTTKGSLYLSDLDTYENKRSEHKIPVYIPYGQTIDILFTDRTMTAYQQGSIRGFIDKGFLEAWVVQNIEVDENAQQFVPVYEIEIDDKLLTVDTTNGDVLLNLPQINPNTGDPTDIIPEGTRVVIKKTSSDGNQILISPFPGDSIEGAAASLALVNEGEAIEVQSDDLGNWWIIGKVEGAGPSSNINPVRETFEVTAPISPVFVLSTLPILNSEQVYLNGQYQIKGAVNDYTITGNTVTVTRTLLSGDCVEIFYLIP